MTGTNLFKITSILSLTLLLSAMLVLQGCAGNTGSPWDRSGLERDAQNPPRTLQPQNRATENAPAIRSYEDYLRSLMEQDTAQSAAAQTGRAPLMPIEGAGRAQSDIQDPRFRAQPEPSFSDFEQNTAPRLGFQSETAASFSAAQPIKVALLLPLSGDNGLIGQAMLNAAQLALFDIGRGQFTLLPKDTASTRQGAQRAAQEAIDEGAELILGPLFADGVKAIAPLVNRHNILNIAFSTDWTVAGGNSFVMGILPFAQVQRVTDYVVATQDIREFGLIAPQTPYGNIAAASFDRSVRNNNAAVVKAMRYSPLENNITEQMRAFFEYDRRKDAYDIRMEELTLLVEGDPENPDTPAPNPSPEILEEYQKLSTRNTVGELPFKALLVPVGGEDARAIINLVRYFDIEPEDMQLMGTGLWDDPGLAREAAMEGAVFAAPSPEGRRSFERRYEETYGQRPPRISSLAYDGTALAAVLAQRARPGEFPYTKQALLNPNGFAGIDGIFRFRRDGLIERGMAILAFENGEIVVKDPAPVTFQQITQPANRGQLIQSGF